MKKIILIGLVGVVGLAGCQQRPADAVLLEEQPAIFPDYNGVTVPAGIAPLNFNVVDEGVDLVDVTVAGSKGGEVHTQGDYADFSEDDWHTLTEQNRGGELTVTVCGRKDKTLRYMSVLMLWKSGASPTGGLHRAMRCIATWASISVTCRISMKPPSLIIGRLQRSA